MHGGEGFQRDELEPDIPEDNIDYQRSPVDSHQ
jgi:hypothetical protein